MIQSSGDGPPLVVAPNPILQKISNAVDIGDEALQKIISNMWSVMYYARGIGLSAVQIGILKRVIVIDTDVEFDDEDGYTPGHTQYAMINPIIKESSSDVNSYSEGCLSFPRERVDITRPESITVEYFDSSWKKQVIHASGMLATCIQHEIDHLNGITIDQNASKLKRAMILERVRKRKKTMRNVI